jgi:hypothetical protein
VFGFDCSVPVKDGGAAFRVLVMFRSKFLSCFVQDFYLIRQKMDFYSRFFGTTVHIWRLIESMAGEGHFSYAIY